MKLPSSSLVLIGLLINTVIVSAQTFTALYSFSPFLGYGTNSDGANPGGGLVLAGGTLYGTAVQGGNYGEGTVFAINTANNAFMTLYSFTRDIVESGAEPHGELILSGNTLYGTAASGGNQGSGTVFAFNTDTFTFTCLHSFEPLSGPIQTNSDGAHPMGGLALSGDTLYGTAESGGSSRNGTVFAVNIDGTSFTTLHSFTTLDELTGTNYDGASPRAGLLFAGDTLYGTTRYGGEAGVGTVFAIKTNGTGFTNLHSFNQESDGANPSAKLILSGNTLYGTALLGGSWYDGTIFAINTDGTGFTVLHHFRSTTGPGIPPPPDSGAQPNGGLVLSGNTLYGTTGVGGDWSHGTIFAINTNGTDYARLYQFPPFGFLSRNKDGAYPHAGLVLSGQTFYGTAFGGGASGSGTVFSFSFAPKLAISSAGPDVVLKWPMNSVGFDYSGFELQSTTNLSSPDWTTISPTPVIVNGQYTVTNPISGTQQFYRLSQ